MVCYSYIGNTNNSSDSNNSSEANKRRNASKSIDERNIEKPAQKGRQRRQQHQRHKEHRQQQCRQQHKRQLEHRKTPTTAGMIASLMKIKGTVQPEYTRWQHY